MFMPYQIQVVHHAASRILTSNHSRATSRILTSNHSRAMAAVRI